MHHMIQLSESDRIYGNEIFKTQKGRKSSLDYVTKK